MEPSRTARVDRWLAGFAGMAAIALVAAIVPRWAGWGAPYGNPHAWVSTHFATMAHAYATGAAWTHGGVPLQNYPPHGTLPDHYTHWPPLFPMALAAVFSAFGERAFVTRTFTLALTALGALLTGAAVAEATRDRRAGALAVATWLVLPVVQQFAVTTLHLHLAVVGLAALALGVAGWLNARRWGPAVTGIGAFVAVGASWEPALAGIGLGVAALAARSRPLARTAAVVLLVAGGTAAVVIGWYVVAAPSLAAELSSIVAFRTGLGAYTVGVDDPHRLVDLKLYGGHHTLADALSRYTRWLWTNAPTTPVAALGLGLALARRRALHPAVAATLAATNAPWILWFLGMPNHAIHHEYELLLAAPGLAAAVGVGWHTVATARWRLAPWLAAALALAALWPVHHAVRGHYQETPDGLVVWGQRIRSASRRQDVVLTPALSMVIVYHAGRHVIRGVGDAGDVAAALPGLTERFPGKRLLVAYNPRVHGKAFRSLAETSPRVHEERDLLVLDVTP